MKDSSIQSSSFVKTKRHLLEYWTAVSFYSELISSANYRNPVRFKLATSRLKGHHSNKFKFVDLQISILTSSRNIHWKLWEYCKCDRKYTLIFYLPNLFQFSFFTVTSRTNLDQLINNDTSSLGRIRCPRKEPHPRPLGPSEETLHWGH